MAAEILQKLNSLGLMTINVSVSSVVDTFVSENTAKIICVTQHVLMRMNLMDHLDYDAINTLKDVMEDDFSLLIDTFVADSQERIEKLNAIIDSNDSDAIRRGAHSFKGSCSNIGAVLLTKLCAELEAKALVGNLQGLNVHVGLIQQEFTHVRSLLLVLVD